MKLIGKIILEERLWKPENGETWGEVIFCQGLGWVLDKRVGVRPPCIHSARLLLFGSFFYCNNKEAGSSVGL